MIFKTFGLILAAFAMSLSAGTAGFAETEPCNCEPDPDPEPDPVLTKGNNGWGNGIDGANPGTERGGTRETKANRQGWAEKDFTGR